jgi:hypothetical protein
MIDWGSETGDQYAQSRLSLLLMCFIAWILMVTIVSSIAYRLRSAYFTDRLNGPCRISTVMIKAGRPIPFIPCG